jgi:hypothetical protein
MKTPDTYMTSFALPLELRSRLDALRLQRAQRECVGLPSLRTLILEGLEHLLAHELSGEKR